MSKNTQQAEELTRELRQFTGLAASFFRAAAARLNMTVTDLQVIDVLESGGPSTAGQLADLTGLTTGAITGMLNRLEEAGIVRRERDPNDGRRVIVRIEKEKEEIGKIAPVFNVLGKGWEELTSNYTEEQITFLLDFLKQSNTRSRQEIMQLQEGATNEEGVFSAPLSGFTSGRFVVASGISRLILHAGEEMSELYKAQFEGPAPSLTNKEGVVTLRYPRRLLGLGGQQRTADVALNSSVPWEILLQGGASDVSADLKGIKLTSIEVKGGLSTIRLELPVPEERVPIRISGGAAEIVIRRPAGAPARAHLKGWASSFVFDQQTLSNIGNNIRLQSANFEPTAPHYDIEVLSSASVVTITNV